MFIVVANERTGRPLANQRAGSREKSYSFMYINLDLKYLGKLTMNRNKWSEVNLNGSKLLYNNNSLYIIEF